MRVGLAMFTVRTSFQKDPEKTMKEIACTGYKAIEIANHHAEKDPGTGFGFSAKDLKKISDDNGIIILGAHIIPTGGGAAIETFYYQDDQLKKIIDYYVELGSRYLSFPIDFFSSVDYLFKRCDLYNHIGALCKPYGIKFLLFVLSTYRTLPVWGMDIPSLAENSAGVKPPRDSWGR
jgi:sugar phosphate isomerase/epimerase